MEHDSERDKCFIDAAIKKKDASLCDKISDENTRYPCYSTIAVLKQDRSICEKLPENQKIQCTMLFRNGI